ncbi:hypothetical protein ACLIBH_04055 [Virgibacillus sp. W0430]|uniref:hypothetical protein n=1 Tax=Virgibacillus sp. W0430 TaxID=3391580 RepID=UPI003F44A53A
MDALIIACKEGNLQAFDKLIGHYSPAIERLLFQMGMILSLRLIKKKLPVLI